MELEIDEVAIEVQVETKGPDHCASVIATLKTAGYRLPDAPDAAEAPTPERERRLGEVRERQPVKGLASVMETAISRPFGAR